MVLRLLLPLCLIFQLRMMILLHLRAFVVFVAFMCRFSKSSSKFDNLLHHASRETWYLFKFLRRFIKQNRMIVRIISMAGFRLTNVTRLSHTWIFVRNLELFRALCLHERSCLWAKGFMSLSSPILKTCVMCWLWVHEIYLQFFYVLFLGPMNLF